MQDNSLPLDINPCFRVDRQRKLKCLHERGLDLPNQLKSSAELRVNGRPCNRRWFGK